MGDRVLIILKKRSDGRATYSPVFYAHWSGSDAKTIIQRLRNRMGDRYDDLDYCFARLVQDGIHNDSGNTGFGCWNSKVDAFGALNEESHGDAGRIVVDITEPTWEAYCADGYGFDSDADKSVMEMKFSPESQ